jgi:hypothetical protein
MMAERGTISDIKRVNEMLSGELYAALCESRTVPPLSTRYPALTIDDAYAISLSVSPGNSGLQRRAGPVTVYSRRIATGN